MRRLRDRQPGGLFRGGELPRLMTMIVMLCVLGMMIRRAADHDTWRFMTGEPANLKDGATEPGPPHKPRVRSRQAARPADGIVISAPESDVILSLQHPAKPPVDATPHNTPGDEPPAESIVAAAADPPTTALTSDEPAPQAAEPKSESAPVELALAPQAESSAAQTPEEESPVAAPADEAGTPSDSKPASAVPSPAAPTTAPAQAQPTAQTEPTAPASAEPEKSAAQSPANTAPANTAPEKSAPENSEPAVGPSPYSASQQGESLHKPLYRPHLPANPDKILQPGTLPEKPEIEPALLDEDMEERRQFDHECEAISDRTPLGPEEMFAYWRLLRWSESQTADEMAKRARTDVRYNDLLQRPEEFRGELLKVRLHIRQVLQEDAPPDIPVAVHHYYQALGWNDASQSWFYFCIFTDLPEGMKLGDVVYEEGTFVGYFLKTHTYLDGKGTKTKAPILIGRMIYHPTPSIARNPNEWIWSWSIGGVLLLLFVLRWGWRFFGRRKSAPEIKGLLRRPGLSATEDEPLDIADWLDQVEAAQSEKEIKPADSHDSNGSAHGNGLPLRRDRGLDWTEDSER